MDLAVSHPAPLPSRHNPLFLDGLANHDHSQHGGDGSCPFCNSSRRRHSGLDHNLTEQASTAAGVVGGIAGAVLQPVRVPPGDMVSLSHRDAQENPRNKPSGDQAVLSGLDLGYGPDARPVSAGVFEEQRHRDSFTKKESQTDASFSRNTDTARPHAADQDDKEGRSLPMDDDLRVGDETQLSSEDRQVLEQLRQRDAEVRAHEQAHVAAGGQFVTAGASYTYETGPDGRQYAVGGEVSIDTSPVPGNPEQTEQKAQTIRRAALAPASPSAQDVKVATSAAQMEAEARTERVQKEQEERQTGADGDHSSSSRVQDQTAPAQTASDQATSSPAGFFSRTPDFALSTTVPPLSETSPTQRAPFIQAYRNQLAMVQTGSPF